MVFGASRPSQMEDNLKAIEVLKKWTPEVEKAISEVFNNQPKPMVEKNFRDLSDRPLRR